MTLDEDGTPVALVTGGGSGIGRATALALKRLGYAVAVSGRRSGPLDETVGLLGGGLAIAADHCDEEGAERMLRETLGTFGRLDVLVCNAGAIRRNVPVHEIDPDRFDEQIRSNLRGPFLVSRAVLRHWVDTPSARERAIVNVSSTLAERAFPGVAAYSAAKAGVLALTRSIAVEYGAYGIRCNCVCPDIIDTPLARADRSNWDELAERLPARYPLGRIGAPEDVAAMIAHLATPAAGWTTGVVVDVDGGFGAGQ
jgi:NAD(P)-dependent dehydrogenase (short-subunit alcohol dehydrogenase family)